MGPLNAYNPIYCKDKEVIERTNYILLDTFYLEYTQQAFTDFS